MAQAFPRWPSIDAAGTEANGSSTTTPRVSDDGRRVAFDSDASNLVPDDDDPGDDIFLYDSVPHTLARISSSLGALGLALPVRPRVSADGDHVVFVAYDGNGAAQLVRYARADGSLLRLLDAPVSDAPQDYAISEDGSRVVFGRRGAAVTAGYQQP